MIHRSIQWVAAGWRWRRTTRAAWRAGADLVSGSGLLAALAGPVAPELAMPGAGAHRALGELAFEEIAEADDDYQPRHGLDDTPPSIRPALELMTPTERAKELVRQLGQATWHPWRGLPRMQRIRFVAATVARRHGVPLLLGTFRREVALP